MWVSWLSQDRYFFALAVFFILECIFQPLWSSSAKVLVLTARKYHTADLVFPSFLCLTIFSHGPRLLLETRNGFAFLRLVCFCCLRQGFGVLGLPLQTRLASNSRDVSICLCLTSARIKGYLSPVVSLPTFEMGLSRRQSWEDSLWVQSQVSVMRSGTLSYCFSIWIDIRIISTKHVNGILRSIKLRQSQHDCPVLFIMYIQHLP